MLILKDPLAYASWKNLLLLILWKMLQFYIGQVQCGELVADFLPQVDNCSY